MSAETSSYTAVPQIGRPGHCHAAQVFGPDDLSVASFSATEDPAVATGRAQALADVLNGSGEKPVAWPKTSEIVLPRDEKDRRPDPVAFLLGLAAEPWKVQPPASLLRDSDEVDVPRKAEAEMAAALHWLVGFAVRHGDDWGGHYETEVERLKASAEEKRKAA